MFILIKFNGFMEVYRSGQVTTYTQSTSTTSNICTLQSSLLTDWVFCCSKYDQKNIPILGNILETMDMELFVHQDIILARAKFIITLSMAL